MAKMISLDSLKAPVTPEAMRAELESRGCASSSCGSSDGPADMDTAVSAKIKEMTRPAIALMRTTVARPSDAFKHLYDRVL